MQQQFYTGMIQPTKRTSKPFFKKKKDLYLCLKCFRYTVFSRNMQYGWHWGRTTPLESNIRECIHISKNFSQPVRCHQHYCCLHSFLSSLSKGQKYCRQNISRSPVGQWSGRVSTSSIHLHLNLLENLSSFQLDVSNSYTSRIPNFSVIEWKPWVLRSQAWSTYRQTASVHSAL